MVTPGMPPIPHVGGPITGPPVPTVLIGGMPAAVMGNMCVCVGPPDTIIMGSTGVFIGGKPAARMGDPTAHGGVIVAGCPTVLIGEVAPGSPASPVLPLPVKQAMAAMNSTAASSAAQQVATMKSAAQKGVPFCEKCAALAAAKAEEKKNPKPVAAAMTGLKTDQSVALTDSAKSGTPFCEKCAAAAAANKK